MKAIILAAGFGSRLGSTQPKGLTKLPDGESILGRQVRILKSSGLEDITIVVGYKKELIISHLKNVQFIVNPDYSSTNTAKSLLRAIEKCNDDVLWANGDIVYDEEIIALTKRQIGNTVVVNNAVCGEEEVKYRTNEKGYIVSISKETENAQGEALGINLVTKDILNGFIHALHECKDDDYFERAIQILIDKQTVFEPLNVSNFRCIEIDTKEDLEKALKMFS